MNLSMPNKVYRDFRAGFAEPDVLASKVVDNDEGHTIESPGVFDRILRFSVVTRKT